MCVQDPSSLRGAQCVQVLSGVLFRPRRMAHTSFILPPASFLLPPASFLIPPSSFILHPSSLILPPSSLILPPSSFILPPSVYIRGDINGWCLVGILPSSWRILHPLYSSREREAEEEDEGEDKGENEGEDGEGDGDCSGGGRRVSGEDAIEGRGGDATWGD